MKFYFLFLIFICGQTMANFTVNKEFPVSEVALSKTEGSKYVDVIIVTYKGSGKKWSELKELFLDSRSHYQRAGIMLNLTRAVEVKMRRSEQKHIANNIDGIDPDQGLQPYFAMTLRKVSLHDQAERIFEKLSFLSKTPESTLFVVISNGIFYKAYYTRDGERVALNKGVQGFSFPAYSFMERIPHHLRGFVSIKPNTSGKTLSHEFGHKLINVSHEGLDTCPKFSGGGVPGLMGYGRSTEIFSGRKGRFHQERLHLSPFVYTIINGKRVQNPDYEEHGHYRDPIYKGKFFLTPECP